MAARLACHSLQLWLIQAPLCHGEKASGCPISDMLPRQQSSCTPLCLGPSQLPDVLAQVESLMLWGCPTPPRHTVAALTHSSSSTPSKESCGRGSSRFPSLATMALSSYKGRSDSGGPPAVLLGTYTQGPCRLAGIKVCYHLA